MGESSKYALTAFADAFLHQQQDTAVHAVKKALEEFVREPLMSQSSILLASSSDAMWWKAMHRPMDGFQVPAYALEEYTTKYSPTKQKTV